MSTTLPALPALSQPRPAIRAALAAAGYAPTTVNPVFAAREQRLLRELSALNAMRAANGNGRGAR